MGSPGAAGSCLLRDFLGGWLQQKSSLEPVHSPPGVGLVVTLLALPAPRDGELCSQADAAVSWGSPAHLPWDLGRHSYLSEPWLSF